MVRARAQAPHTAAGEEPSMKNTRHRGWTVLTLLILTASLRADDWPAYQKDARRTAVSQESLAFPLGPAWVHRASELPKPSWSEPGRSFNVLDFDCAFHPVVTGGLLYYGSSADDTVYALNAADGAIRWTFTAGAPVRHAPHVAGGRCHFAADDGIAYCLDAKTGAVIWTFKPSHLNRQVSGNGRLISRWPCRTGVVVLDDVVYLTAGMWPTEGTYFYALDAATGKVRWCNDTLNAMYLAYPHDGQSFGGPTPQGYLATDGQHLLVPTGQSAPALFDARTGKLVHWGQQSPGGTWLSIGDGFVMTAAMGWQGDQDLRLGEGPVFWGDGLAFYGLADGRGFEQGKWRGYDSLPGSERHKRERWRGQINPIGGRTRAVLTRDRFYAAGMGTVESIDCATDKLSRLWAVEHWNVYNLALTANALIVGGNGVVTALAPADGRTLWQGRVDGQARGLAVADGVLYVSTDKGMLYAFAAGRPNVAAAPRKDPEVRARTGFGLVLGAADTQLAVKLASAQPLNVVTLLPEAAVPAARKQLLGRGYGPQVVVHPVPADGALPYADYFANEIVVAGPLGKLQPKDIYRILHPCTGRLWFANMTPAAVADFIRAAGIPAGEVKGQVVQRGPLPGAFDWNSTNKVDQLVKWPMELLWFGGPGRERTIARHRTGMPPPVAAHGRVVALGDGYVNAVDAYNGLELWTRYSPNYRYISADDQHCYIAASGNAVFQCDAQTGRLLRIFGKADPVVLSLDQPQSFNAKSGPMEGKITVSKSATAIEVLLDTATPLPDDKDNWLLWFDFRKRDDRLTPSGQGAFPLIVNTKTGTLRPFKGFDQTPIPQATASRSGQSVLLRIPLDEIARLTGGVPADFDLSAEVRLFQSFDVKFKNYPLTNGRDPWRNGTATFVMSGPKIDSASPFSQVPRDDLAALPAHARDWGKMPLHVRHDGNVPRLPLAAQINPELRDRINPITGEANDLFYLRGYGCSGTIASAVMDMFRSGTFGMYDLRDDSGMRNFTGMKPGCRITVVPALGVLVSTEGNADCFCPYNFSTTLALAPASRQSNEDWALFVDQTRVGQMQQLALNFGAPGDRRDGDGVLWLGYPRQPMMFATGGSLGQFPKAFGFPVTVDWIDGEKNFRVNAERTPITGTPVPWVAASGFTGVRKLSIGMVYHEPKTTCLAPQVTVAPKVDGVLNDAAWAGEPGFAVMSEGRNAEEIGRVRVRHDPDHLYLAFEQQPVFDRKGVAAPWGNTHFDVLLKDVDRAAYAHFKVSGQGAESAKAVSGVVAVPRVTNITVDGKPEDWGTQGLELNLGKGRGTMRVGWNDSGLLVRMQVPPQTEKDRPAVRAQFANLEQPAVVETILHTLQGTAQTLDVAVSNAASKEEALNIPLARGDATKKNFDDFRKAAPSATQPVAVKGAQEVVMEALLPLTHLNLKPAPGTTVAFQVVGFDPASNDQNISGGAGARRALFNSGSLLSLQLTGGTGESKPVNATSEKRDFFGVMPVFAPAEKTIPGEAWASAVVADDTSLRTEIAIPWNLLQAAGLTPARLVAQFRTPGTVPPNLEQLYNSFRARAVRLHTEAVPLKAQEYTVRLHFADLESTQPKQRVFDIKLQGKTVAENVDIVQEAGGPRRALTKTFRVVPDKSLDIEFVPRAGVPVISGLELLSAPVR